ncbi:MAG: MYXO-CTERM sorting domain-containing protein [Myxococcota bacterium]
MTRIAHHFTTSNAHSRVRGLVCGLFAGLIWLAASPSAEACSFPGSIEHLVDPAEEAVDTTAPTMLGAEVAISRNPSGSGDPADSCNGTGTLTLDVAAQDDRTDDADMGYLLTVVEGTPPSNLFLDDQPVREDNIGILMVFSDSGQEIDFTLGIQPVDRGGNIGELLAVEIRSSIDDSGDDSDDGSGCRVGGGGQTGLLALLAVLILFGLGRRQRPARASR